MISTRLALWAVGYGLLIWFEATLIIRWAGDWIFVPGDTVWIAGTFAVTSVVVFLVGWFFFASFQTPPLARAAAALLICATGLMADAFVLAWIDVVFPDMDAGQERLFAVWLAWAYGLGLLSGIWPKYLPRVPAA
jgi:hypothetical protein